MMLSKLSAALGLTALTTLGGGIQALRSPVSDAAPHADTHTSTSQTRLGGSLGERDSVEPGARRIEALPSALGVERIYAFNFLSPDLNQIDGSSAGDSFYTAWDFGYGSEWNNLVSHPITWSLNSPRDGDGKYALNSQTWHHSLDGNGLSHGGMVDSLGIQDLGLNVSVNGSFSTYNTGGSPYDTASNGVPAGWDNSQPSNSGSMGLSHLWLDARSWNNTDSTVRISVDRLESGQYMLILWLNPTNHDPPRSARIDLRNRSFRFEHNPGADYPEGNRLILTDIEVPAQNLSFLVSTYNNGIINMDSSLAGFAVIKLR